ncbi:MAG: hypothetical protein CSB44_03150 [Gammaproteobacteria bacterium]|nr:MAG: hypothetical protein CSB44_03150 [Gammaproteobacteria bacterium]
MVVTRNQRVEIRCQSLKRARRFSIRWHCLQSLLSWFAGFLHSRHTGMQAAIFLILPAKS